MVFQRTTAHLFWVQNSSLKGHSFALLCPAQAIQAKSIMSPVLLEPALFTTSQFTSSLQLVIQNDSVGEGGSRIHRLFSQPPVVKDFWIGSLFLAQNCHGNPSLYGCCWYLLQQLVYAPTEQLLKSFVQLLANEFELALLGALTVVFFLTLKRELISHSLPWHKLLSGIKRRKAKVQDTGWEVLLWGLSPSEPCCQDPQEEINFSGHDIASHTLLLLSKGLLSSC